jgi:curved DNA-binding protein CbpA
VGSLFIEKEVEKLKMVNLYEILGVDVDANFGELKIAFKKLIKTVHPDYNPDPKANENTKSVIFAYRTLSDPVSRLAYDGLLGVRSRPELWEKKEDEEVESLDDEYNKRRFKFYDDRVLDIQLQRKDFDPKAFAFIINTAQNHFLRAHIPFEGYPITGLVAELEIPFSYYERKLYITLENLIQWNMYTPDFRSYIGRYRAEDITNIILLIKEKLRTGQYEMELIQNERDDQDNSIIYPFYKIKKLRVGGIDIISDTGIQNS